MSQLHDILLRMLLVGMGVSCVAQADENAFLVSVQNHCFVDADQNGYTNGIFVSKIRSASHGASQVDDSTLLAPLLNWIGLPAPTLTAATLEQIMITPRDLERPNPAPDDIPYVGLLALRLASIHVHQGIADTLALNIGAMGPASGAEQMQKLIHHVNGATRPQGWHTQGPTQVLVAAEAYRAFRYAFGAADRGFDATALLGGTLGNRESSLGSTFLLRYGIRLERSFPSIARVVGRSGDPFALDRGWFAFAGFSADRIMGDRWIGNGARNNIAQPRKSQIDPVLGFTYGWARSSLSFSLHSVTPLVESSHQRQKYGSISYLWNVD